MTRRLPALAVGALVLAAWALLARTTSPLLLPGPGAVLARAVAERAALGEALATTASAAALGLGLAILVGTALALAFQLSRTLELGLYPPALVLQTLPVVAVAPLLVVWLGYGRPVAVAAAALVSFFPVLTSTHRGLSSASAEQLELLRLYGAGRLWTLLRLRLPLALPWMLAGLRSAAGLAVVGAVVGEFVGSNGVPRALGFLVLQAIRGADTALAFAATGAAAALSLLAFAGVRAAERRLVGRWFGAPAGPESP